MELRKSFYFVRELVIALVLALLLPAAVYRGVVAVVQKPNEVKTAEQENVNVRNQRYELEKKRSNFQMSGKEETAELDAQISALQQSINANDAISKKWSDRWNFIYFITAAVCGVLFLLAGLLVDIPLLGTGLVLGGGFSLVAGYTAYWSYLSDKVIFASLCLGLLLLVAAFWWYSRKKTL